MQSFTSNFNCVLYQPTAGRIKQTNGPDPNRGHSLPTSPVDTSPIHLSITSFILLSFVKKNPKILPLLHLGQDLIPDLETPLFFQIPVRTITCCWFTSVFSKNGGIKKQKTKRTTLGYTTGRFLLTSGI